MHQDELRVRLIVSLTLLLALGVFFAFLRPFETSDLDWIDGSLYWIGLLLAGFLPVTALDTWWSIRPPQRAPTIKLTIKIFLTSLLVALLVILINRIDGWISALLAMAQVVAIATLAILLIELVVANLIIRQDVDPAKNSENKPATTKLLQRLPIELRSAELHAIAAEDHYVRVITSQGDCMILMRLGDAIDETAPIKGQLTHRSWWVAEQGIERIEKSKQSLRIKLKSGQTALVSRSGATELRKRGWI